jgi:hypothetical protein
MQSLAGSQPFNLQPFFKKNGSRRVVLETQVCRITFVQPEKKFDFAEPLF